MINGEHVWEAAYGAAYAILRLGNDHNDAYNICVPSNTLRGYDMSAIVEASRKIAQEACDSAVPNEINPLAGCEAT
jgi:hypothetical protein